MFKRILRATIILTILCSIVGVALMWSQNPPTQTVQFPTTIKITGVPLNCMLGPILNDHTSVITIPLICSAPPAPAGVVTVSPVTITVPVNGTVQFTASIDGVPVTNPPPVNPPPTPGVMAIGAKVKVPNPVPGPGHVWAKCVSGGGCTGGSTDIAAGMAGTVKAGPITTGNGNVWWQFAFDGGVTGWGGAQLVTVQ